MLKNSSILMIILCCLFSLTLVFSVSAEELQFSASLKSNKIGPKPVDSSAQGEIVFHLDTVKQELSYALRVEQIKDIYMAHLHIGPSDHQGLVAAWLYPLKTPANHVLEGEFNGTLAEGIIRPEDLRNGITFEDLIESMQKGNAYVNVHTTKYIPGEIRGQLQ